MKNEHIYRPCFKNVLVEIIEKKKEKKEKSVLLPEEMENNLEKYVLCKVIDHARDCVLFKTLIESGQERYVVVESHMINVVEIDGKQYNLVPEHAILMISSKI